MLRVRYVVVASQRGQRERERERERERTSSLRVRGVYCLGLEEIVYCLGLDM